MKLIIDIPEHVYEHAKEESEDSRDEFEAMRAIANGTQQETGRWINSHIPESTLCECSACGFTCGAYSFNYCPNCGAKMEVQEC